MSPFARLGVFAAGATIWAAVAALWIYVAPAVATAAALGGLASALVVTLEIRAVEPSSDVAKPEEEAPATPDFALRRRDRRDIERAAEAAREAAAE